jgi:hypothetical protein
MSSYVSYDTMISLIMFEYEIPTISEFSFIGQQYSDMINAVFFKDIVAKRILQGATYFAGYWLFGGET